MSFFIVVLGSKVIDLSSILASRMMSKGVSPYLGEHLADVNFPSELRVIDLKEDWAE